MNTFLTADWHLGEDRFAIMQRPFASVEAQTSYLVGCHNELVTAEDRVFVLGDVLSQKCDIEQFLPEIARFHGKKILVRGNHDNLISDELFAPYFDMIVEDGGGLELSFDGIPCYMTHYPTCGKTDRFNLVGHIHSAWKFQLNSVNVGVDAHHFRPVNAEQIPFFLRAISEFYDADVWAAYDAINKDHFDTRGAKTRYFKG